MSNLPSPAAFVTTVALQPEQYLIEIGTRQDAGAKAAGNTLDRLTSLENIVAFVSDSEMTWRA